MASVKILVAAAFWTSSGVDARGMRTCSEQKDCIAWSATKACNCGECAVRVCITWGSGIDRSDTKFWGRRRRTECPDDLSYTCQNRNRECCPHHGLYKMEEVEEPTAPFCQVGHPGQSLYFGLKNGMLPCGTAHGEPVDLGGDIMTVPQCTSELLSPAFGCGNKAFTCVWKFDIPDDMPCENYPQGPDEQFGDTGGTCEGSFSCTHGSMPEDVDRAMELGEQEADIYDDFDTDITVKDATTLPVYVAAVAAPSALVFGAWMAFGRRRAETENEDIGLIQED